jgi:hypothetical protein
MNWRIACWSEARLVSNASAAELATKRRTHSDHEQHSSDTVRLAVDRTTRFGAVLANETLELLALPIVRH